MLRRRFCYIFIIVSGNENGNADYNENATYTQELF